MQTVSGGLDGLSELTQRMDKNDEMRLKMMELHFQHQQSAFESIERLIGIRERHGERITTILSDYVQMIQQMSVVTTLTLGMAVGLFGALIGGQFYLHPDWKNALFTISSMITISFSIISVLESFFLGVQLNQVEARFIAGVYPNINLDDDVDVTNQTHTTGSHKKLKPRVFNVNELDDMNATFNFILLTFFLSFFSFAFSLLGTTYLGIGMSNSIFKKDKRLITDAYSANIFANDTRFPGTVSSVEPSYLTLSWIVTALVIGSYIVVTLRFFRSYAKKFYAKDLIRFMAICMCSESKGLSVNDNVLTPIELSANQFNDYQIAITRKAIEYFGIQAQSVNNIEHICNDFKKLPSIQRDTEWKFESNKFSWIKWVSNAWRKTMVMIDNALLTVSELARTKRSKNIITSAAIVHLDHIALNIFILDSWTGSEEAASISFREYELSPFGRFKFFLMCLWGLSGGFAITALLFVFSLLTYPVFVIFRCTALGKKHAEPRGVCTYVHFVTVVHIMWCYGIYLTFVKVSQPNKKARKSFLLRPEEKGKRYENAMETMGRSIKRGRRGKRGYSSISLKL